MLLKHPLLNAKHWLDPSADRVSCPCCGDFFEHRRSVWFYRYHRCRRCRSIFVFPRPTQMAYERRMETVAIENVSPVLSEMDLSQIQGLADRILFVAQSHERGIAGISEMHFLDFGCGVGRTLLAADALHFNQVQGYEPSTEMTKAAFREISGERIQITADLNKLTYRYDIVFCADVIEHCLSPRKVLREISSRMAPGGILHLSTPVCSGLSSWLLGQAWWCAGPNDHLQLFNHSALREAVEASGLQVIQCFTDTLIPWITGSPSAMVDRWAMKLWRRLNNRIAGNNTLWGDNLIIIARNRI